MRPVFACLAVLIAAALPATASAANPIPKIGIGEQNPAMFSNPYFKQLNVKYVRVVTAWNSLDVGWQRAQLDDYMTRARAAGVEVMLGFGHARSEKRSVRRRVPGVKEFTKMFLRYRKRYPWVRDYLTWNEANHCGEPTCHKAARVARFYNNIRHNCYGCQVVGGDVLDTPTMVPWVKLFWRHARHDDMIWGLHNYVDANRFTTSGTRTLLKVAKRGRIWFTETGGLVVRRNRSRIAFPGNIKHAAASTKYVFRLARLSPRVRRIYFYHWQPATVKLPSWDSALVDKRGKPRPAYKVLKQQLERFRRAAARRARQHRIDGK